MRWPARFILSLFVAIFAYQITSKILSSSNSSYKNHQPQYEIESAFLDSWIDYRVHAWGKDIYGPISKTGRNMGKSDDPLGWIIVDSIDTMMIMYNKTKDEKHRQEFLKEINLAEVWIRDSLNYDIDSEVNIFETTIRMVGGLLAGYYCSLRYQVGNASIFLDKAVDLADRLLPAFYQTETGIPYSSINLASGRSVKNHVDNGASSTAEFTTLQMELKYLSYITGNDTYWKLSERIYEPLYKNNNLLGRRYNGLIPIYTQPDSGIFQGTTIRFGSRGDSFYEYLLKQYLLTGEVLYKYLYDQSIAGMKKYLLGKSKGELELTYIGEKEYGLHGPTSPKFDHLVCFMGGLLAMGATEGRAIAEARQRPDWSAVKQEDWSLAEDLTRTCYEMYHQTPAGLSPEIVVFNDGSKTADQNWWQSETGDFYVKPLDRHNLQRPETVESIMFLYQLSGDEKYREWGWEIFRNFIEHTKVEQKDDSDFVAYASLKNVIQPPSLSDNMESFWLAETLKYLYLLFDDNLDLSEIVFNTEAHPFPVMDKKRLIDLNLYTGWNI